MNILKKSYFFILLIFFTGCSVPEFKYNYELSKTNYDSIINSLVKKSENQIFPYIEKDEVLLVSNFADNVTLSSDSKLSFLLTDILKTKLVADHSYTVREIELSKRFKFGKEGFKVLTRDVNNIKSKVKRSRYAIIGTYTLTKNQLILFLKMIDIKTGNIVAASDFSTTLTQEIVDDERTRLKSKDPRLSNIYQPTVL